MIDAQQSYANQARKQAGFEVGGYPADISWTTRFGKTVGIEEKAANDYQSSRRARRLGRQLRELRKNYDLPFLALRFSATGLTYNYRLSIMRFIGGDRKPNNQHFADLREDFEELTKWSLYWGHILFVPENRELAYYRWLQNALDDKDINPFTILAGDDRPTANARKMRDLTPFGRAVKGALGGHVSIKALTSLEEAYSGDALSALSSPASSWKAVKNVGQSTINKLTAFQQLGKE